MENWRCFDEKPRPMGSRGWGQSGIGAFASRLGRKLPSDAEVATTRIVIYYFDVSRQNMVGSGRNMSRAIRNDFSIRDLVNRVGPHFRHIRKLKLDGLGASYPRRSGELFWLRRAEPFVQNSTN
jgi:hypothetical protein